MSGETHRDDDSLFDELDDFILEDAPATDDLEELFTDGKRTKLKRPEQEDAEEEVLFQDTSTVQGSEKFESGRTFSEEKGVHWRGHRLSADDIGIPVDDQEGKGPTASFGEQLGSLLGRGQAPDEEFAVEEPELELVDSDQELISEAGAADATAAADEGLQPPSEEVVLDGPAEATPTDAVAEGDEAGGDWSMEGEADVDIEAESDAEADTTGEPGEQVDEVAAAARDQLQRSRFARGTPSQHPGAMDEAEVTIAGNRVVGAPTRSRGGLRMFTSLAAAVLLLAGGAVVTLRPEWLGLPTPTAGVQRVEIARPNLALEVPMPEKPVAQVATDPAPVDPQPVPTDPSKPPDGQAGHPTDPQPVPTDPQPNPTPDNPKDPVDAQPHGTGTMAIQVDKPDVIQVDETLGIGQLQPPVTPTSKLPELSVVPGAKAFAQLRNGNFFVGTVKAVGSSVLVLRLERGEVTLQRAEIGRVMTLGSGEYNDVIKAVNGTLKLRNQNRFVGTILEGIADDHIILEMKSDRIILPKSAIENINAESSDGVKFDAKDDDTWLKTLSEKQLQDEAKQQKVEGDAVLVTDPAKDPKKKGATSTATPVPPPARKPAKK